MDNVEYKYVAPDHLQNKYDAQHHLKYKYVAPDHFKYKNKYFNINICNYLDCQVYRYNESQSEIYSFRA